MTESTPPNGPVDRPAMIDEIKTLLTDQERVMIQVLVLPDNADLTIDHIRDIRKAAAEYVQLHNIKKKQLAHELGRATPVVVEFFNDSYKGRNDTLAREINGWMELDARRRKSRQTTRFVRTAVADLMIDVARDCMESGVVGLVYGPAGIGKTMTSEAICAEITGSIYVLIGTDDAGIVGLRSAIYEAVTRNKHTVKSGREAAAITERLTGSGRLIVIDQAHKLSDRALEYMFDLHDRTKCPILMVGTARLGERLARDKDPRFGQLYSRVAIRCNLVRVAQRRNGGDGGKLFSIDDIRRVFARGKVRLTAGAAKYLQDVSNTLGYGSLRLCDRILRWAEKRARKRAGVGRDEAVTVTDEDLQRAHMILDDDESTLMQHQSVEDQSRPLAATA